MVNKAMVQEKTNVLYFESISNPMLTVADILELSRIGGGVGSGEADILDGRGQRTRKNWRISVRVFLIILLSSIKLEGSSRLNVAFKLITPGKGGMKWCVPLVLV